MAFADDLQNFLESQLLSYDPSIDLSANSPAQLKIIQPLLARLGDDPFSTDIPTFITDRLVQEFPELAADNAGMAEDILAKPLQMILESFKREIELVKLGQSLANIGLMSEDEADALGANWFATRDAGDYASGQVRIYFSQPSTVRVSTDKACQTSDGRSYFPIQNYFINAQQMAFNRQGTFYFLDVSVRAESPGDTYNVDRGDINSILSVPGVVKVANLTAFITGAPRETNTDFASRIENSLTDRSLVTKRGILARVPNEFTTQVRALQVIGAGEEGMNRDILTGTGQGFLHLAGKATIYGDWVWVSQITYRDDGTDNSITPQPGDTIRFHPISPAPPATIVVEAKIVTILGSSSGLYLFLLDRSPYPAGTVQLGAFSLLKPGVLTISGVPGGIAANITVADNQVHIGGHTDVFARPAQDAEVLATITNVTDDSPLLAITDLTVPTAGQNLVRSASSDFIVANVQVNDSLVIDTGAGFAGTYQVLEIVNATDLRVSSIFSLSSTTNLRARIIHHLQLDLVSPKIPKLPYTASPVADLQTNVGSAVFQFAVTNIQDYGAKIGDTVQVLEGPDAGEFSIVSFGNVAGQVSMDRVATATGANLSFRIYTKQNGLERPLIRIKGIEVLDSTGQTTGITVPYGDAVDIRPDCDFESAGREKTTYDKQLLVFPDMQEWASGGLTADPVGLGSVTNHTDARYTLELDPADGVIRKITNDASNQITTTEINVPPFLWNGNRDKLIALVSEKDNDFPTTVPGTHKTSDLADARPGDSLTIHDGPNQGKYIIIDHRVLELWGKADQGHRKVALIQVDPPLRVDPIRTALDLINQINGSAVYTAADLYGFLQYAADWDNGSGFYQTFLTQLYSTISTTLGISAFGSVADLKVFFDQLLRTSYSVGPSAKGTFRTYFLEPVSAEFYFDEIPTTFDLASDGSKKFRVDPSLPPSQILPESLVPTAPSLWNRNLGVRLTQDTYSYLTDGSSFPVKGIRTGDLLEWYPAINDLPSRGTMTSSWMCITQAGSNIVQLILPQSNGTSEAGYGGVDNYATLTPGQLFFIDSGPDAGSYVITKIIAQDWTSNPPVLQVQLDQPLTHSTETLPLLSSSQVPPNQLDFSSSLPAYVESSTLTFPLSLNAKHLKVEVSGDGGTSWSAVEHTFGAADPYSAIASVVTDINGDGTFAAAVTAAADGTNKLVLTSVAIGPRVRIRISTSPSAPSAHTTLGLPDGTVGFAGGRGAVAVPGTKVLYGSGLGQCQVNDWITLYAANNTSILTNGDDTAYIGSFKITAVGFSASTYWGNQSYIEVDRTDNFPAGSFAYVRWIRHDAPDIEPDNTSLGGKNITDQYVRFRMYDSVSKTLAVADIPWASASIHPLLSTSDQQIQLASPGVVDTGNGQRNYAHKAPYRVLRPGTLRISSTAMSTQRDGALYYVDIPVVGYGPGSELNVGPSDGFVLSGRSKIDGYTLAVGDENFSYSTQEQVEIILPNSVLPVGSSAGLDNQFSLAGQNLQFTYNNAPLVEDLQAFFDAPLDRVTAASMLVRHFLPGYVMLDATYSGGATESVVATDVISYINNIDPDTAEIRTDLIQDIMKKRGASTVTLPLTVIVLFHGTDRRVRGMRSTTAVGITDTPFFKGEFRQTYFIAGEDTSKDSPRPSGEQVFLKRT